MMPFFIKTGITLATGIFNFSENSLTVIEEDKVILSGVLNSSSFSFSACFLSCR
jgi:hypothetical protein